MNPYAAAEPGWQLSFAAVAGLLWLAAPLRDALGRRGVPAAVAEVAAMTLAASLATAPLLAAHFGRLSLVSLPANLVAAPAVAPVMWLGMLAVAAGQVAPGLAAPLNALNAPLVAFVGATAEVAAGLPGATVGLSAGGPVAAALGYALLAAGALAVRAAHRRRGAGRPWRARRLAAAVAVAGVAAALVAAPRSHGRLELRPGETVVSFLDIGQGDATLVQRDGTSVLVDTGPPEGRVDRRLREEGVRRLDALVLTHAQLDHEGAALPVVRGFRPRLVVDGGAGWPTAVQRALPRAAAEAGARVIRVSAGDVLRIGPLTLRVLWPPAAIAAAAPRGDPNNRAIVTHLSAGTFDLLLTADAETDATSALRLPRMEALKVAHHGSDDPGLESQLEQLRPSVAAIEVGRHNTYGHPTPSTLATLRSVPNVFRTDRDGTVRLHVRGTRLTVERTGPDH
jgi:competence protein ComEC